LRDYQQWHRRYDDPASALSWRLRTVQSYIGQALDRYSGPVRVLSSCSGDGRDVLGVLAKRADAERVSAVFVEAHPMIADPARRAAAAVASRIEVRTADAGVTDAQRPAAGAGPPVQLEEGLDGRRDLLRRGAAAPNWPFMCGRATTTPTA
jgi:hypothetical protein